MPRFQYVALDARGQESTGLVEANSANEAIGQLRQAGYFPTGVYEEGKEPASRNGKGKKPATGRRRRRGRASREAQGSQHHSVQKTESEIESTDDFHAATCDADRFRSAVVAFAQRAGKARSRSCFQTHAV